MLGGGMRQAGVLAAAGLVALRTGVERLSEDHRMARSLAERLQGIGGVHVDPAQVETNMVLLDLSPSATPARDVANRLKDRGIRVSVRPPYTLRMVTHRHIGLEQIDDVADAVRGVMLDVASAFTPETRAHVGD
jgi:threonine aldolase